MRYLILFLCIVMAAPAIAVAQPEWTYDDDATGQDKWAQLSPAYADCELGKEQSPIIIGETETKDLPTLNFHYQPGTGYGILNNHAAAVQFNYGQVLTYDKVDYDLKYLVIHSPAEHVTKGHAHLVEFQFMHESKDGRHLILSVFGDPGNQPPAGLNKMLNHIPQKVGDKDMEFTFNPANLIPQDKGYFTYMGSITSPPCTEGIRWVIMKRKLGLKKEQLRQIGKLVKRNARNMQPVYFRKVYETRDIR